MRIVISGRAAVYPESDLLPSHPDAVPVTDPAVLRGLDGYDAEPEDELADDLDAALTKAGVRGGTLTFTFDPARQELRAVTEYVCRRRLTDAQLAALVEETVGAWSDGVGGNGFEVEWDGGRGHLYPNPPGYPLGGVDRDVRAEQLSV